jgi:hypothetical protein
MKIFMSHLNASLYVVRFPPVFDMKVQQSSPYVQLLHGLWLMSRHTTIAEVN